MIILLWNGRYSFTEFMRSSSVQDQLLSGSLNPGDEGCFGCVMIPLHIHRGCFIVVYPKKKKNATTSKLIQKLLL